MNVTKNYSDFFKSTAFELFALFSGAGVCAFLIITALTFAFSYKDNAAENSKRYVECLKIYSQLPEIKDVEHMQNTYCVKVFK